MILNIWLFIFIHQKIQHLIFNVRMWCDGIRRTCKPVWVSSNSLIGWKFLGVEGELGNGTGIRSDPGPQVSTLLGDRPCDCGSLHLTLVVDDHAGVILKIDKLSVLPAERLPLSDHDCWHHLFPKLRLSFFDCGQHLCKNCLNLLEIFILLKLLVLKF